MCAVEGCGKRATDGAHVLKAGEDKSWYIIPLCREHNGKHGGILEIIDRVQFVSATARDKCRK